MGDDRGERLCRLLKRDSRRFAKSSYSHIRIVREMLPPRFA
jgi:hypothetical protein